MNCIACNREVTEICPICGLAHCQQDCSLAVGYVKTGSSQHITLIGDGWPDHIKKISDLTDLELQAKLKHFRHILNEANALREVALVSISAIESEGIKRLGRKTKSFALPGSRTPKIDPKVKKIMMTLGVTQELAQKLLDKLGGG
jgi:hypothetical protein